MFGDDVVAVGEAALVETADHDKETFGKQDAPANWPDHGHVRPGVIQITKP